MGKISSRSSGSWKTDTLSEAAFDALIDRQTPSFQRQLGFQQAGPGPELSSTLLDLSGTKFFVDEIRIGTTFADVAPSPGTGLPGDYNNNGQLDAGDLDLQAIAIRDGGGPEFDLNSDGAINFDDRKIWVNDLKNTWIGDVNLDLEFNSSDMVQVFVQGKYERQEDAKWEEGDWDGNLRFNSGDMVAAFVAGGYERGKKAAATSAVPEPSTWALALLAALTGLAARRRRNPSACELR